MQSFDFVEYVCISLDLTSVSPIIMFQPLMPEFDPDNLLIFKLAGLSSLLSRDEARQNDRAFNLKLTDWRVLVTIGRYGPVSANEVSQRTQTDKGWVSRSVNTLAERDLVTRAVDPMDNRRLNLTLSEAGQRIYSESVTAALDRQTRLLEPLSGDERQALEDLLTKLTDRLKEVSSLR